MMLMGAFAANAQITNGTQAPEISGQRILSVDYPTGYPQSGGSPTVNYGETISIQAYLNAGKTVVMDGSATWCGPCWSFHNSHALRDLYNAYGPEGSDELRVIFVEADPSTAVSELGGINEAPVAPSTTERGNPQGNWLEDVPYPVINNDNLVKSVANGGYGLNAYPSIYIIVPSGVQDQPGTVYNLSRGSLGNMVAAINTARATVNAPAMTGIDYYGKINAEDTRYCGDTGPIRGFITSTFGHAITSAQVQLKKNGEVLDTQDFTLNIGGYAQGKVDFLGFDIDPAADYQMVLTKVNGQDPLTQDTAADFTSEEFSIDLNTSVQATGNVTVTINTDEYPSEMGFYITKYNDAGELIVAWSKTYPNDSATYKEKTFTYTVPAANIPTGGCYGIALIDAYGDGWTFNTPNTPVVDYGVTVTDSDGTVLFTNNGDFGAQLFQDATFTTDGTAGNEEFEASSITVYPNPSNGIFNFSTEETIDVTVTDLTGKTVHTAKGIENGGSINLSGLSTGLYIAKIKGATGEKVEKLIIK